LGQHLKNHDKQLERKQAGVHDKVFDVYINELIVLSDLLQVGIKLVYRKTANNRVRKLVNAEGKV
jgi:hypothetical protein